MGTGLKVLIFLVVVVLEILTLSLIAVRSEGSSDPDNTMAWGFVFFLLFGVFLVVDVAAVIWFLIFVWH